ncbi:MAG: hypothetical protein U1F33_07620 [Alphaproteobacteria bacterium]
MALRIETFSNAKGGNCFFKAIGHPAVRDDAERLLASLASASSVALYDPFGFAEGFAELFPLGRIAIDAVYVQDVERVGRPVLGRNAQPVTDLGASKAQALFLVAFDAQRGLDHVRHLIPSGMGIHTLDAMRIPDDALTNPKRYLDPINFATNFAFFRDEGGHHTRLVTANYWAGYGARNVELWLHLFDGDGRALASWRESPGAHAGSAVVLDSREIRARLGLGPFTGQLFIHVIGAAGHDVVKYALDTYGDDPRVLSCTHDANAWPADLYAGLPAPDAGERVILWVQNSHPRAIPPGSIGLNLMGSTEVRRLDRTIGPFATHALDIATLLPDARWPAQVEIQAGRHFVRPRYEVLGPGERRRIAHPNVERTDLSPDPRIAELGNLMGKGYLLPAPILPLDRFATSVLPTPMSTAQSELPIALVAYDPEGREVARHRFGRLPRHHRTTLDMDSIVDGNLGQGFGHLELVYDFAEGGAADGWLHGLFRYLDRRNGHRAETSFGAHIFNTVLTYRSEPQSYVGPPPGLSTRLFLRLGPSPLETMCHLIYPASTPWHGQSETDLILQRGDGQEVARRRLAIPCGGSRHIHYGETFSAAERREAGEAAAIIIRDVSCRLFGYHGLANAEGAFSLDHMFGF